MSKLKYPNLFSPIKIGKQYFKNRIFAAPTGWIDLDKGGMYNKEAAYYYGRKAMGGAAAVTLGECNVDGELGTGFGYRPNAVGGMGKITGKNGRGDNNFF